LKILQLWTDTTSQLKKLWKSGHCIDRKLEKLMFWFQHFGRQRYVPLIVLNFGKPGYGGGVRRVQYPGVVQENIVMRFQS
jgi:hypothetical protein